MCVCVYNRIASTPLYRPGSTPLNFTFVYSAQPVCVCACERVFVCIRVCVYTIELPQLCYIVRFRLIYNLHMHIPQNVVYLHGCFGQESCASVTGTIARGALGRSYRVAKTHRIP